MTKHENTGVSGTNNTDLAQAVEQLNAIVSEPSVLPRQEISVADYQVLKAACHGDKNKLQRYVKRLQCDEPLEYILGHLEFRGRQFNVDRRVYVTEPENTHLIDAIIRYLNASNKPNKIVAEFGVGCGSLSITLAKEMPDVRVVGVDIDGSALKVAAENARLHGVDIDLLESDMFDSWGELNEPDVIFGDPPWGDQSDDDCYEGTPSLTHFLAMPTLSCFPIGSKTGAHEGIIDAVRKKNWRTHMFLNCGSLEESNIHALGKLAVHYEILEAAPGARILHCYF